MTSSSEVDFSWCLTDPVVAELPGDAPFWIVRRERLDQLLRSKADAALGAELRQPFEVVAHFSEDASHWRCAQQMGGSGAAEPW